MKVLSIATSALLATTVAARATFFSSSDVSVEEEQYKVPGDNPLAHCADPADDILAVKSVDIDPNPPQAGQKLSIVASGVLAKDVEQGATIHVSVKYGLIRILSQTFDLCDTVKDVDLECPLKKGDLKLVKEVELPNEIPPGTYHVEADVTTKDDDTITCLTATVAFHRGGASLFKQDV